MSEETERRTWAMEQALALVGKTGTASLDAIDEIASGIVRFVETGSMRMSAESAPAGETGTVMTVYPGRYMQTRTLVETRHNGESHPTKVYSETNTTAEVVKRIVETVKCYPPTVRVRVEAIGPGAGMADALRSCDDMIVETF